MLLLAAPQYTIAVGDAVTIMVAETAPLAAVDLDASRTWTINAEHNAYESDQVVRVPSTFDGTLGFDVSRVLSPGTSLTTIGSVVDDLGDPNLVFSNLRLSQDRTLALFDVHGLTAATSYRVRAQLYTTDNNQLPTVGVLECRDTAS